jgi:hypothetical protein
MMEKEFTFIINDDESRWMLEIFAGNLPLI